MTMIFKTKLWHVHKEEHQVLMVFVSIKHALSNSGGCHRVILGHRRLKWRPKWLTK